MWNLELPPFAIFYLAGITALLLRGHWRSFVIILLLLISAWQQWLMPSGVHWQFSIMGFELTPWRVDALSLMFGYIFHIAALIAVIYALHIRDTLQQSAALFYAGSALGAVFAGDLLTLFVFWELLALSSVVLVWARRSPQAYRAGIRYLLMQVLSGVLLLAGILFY